MEAILTPDIQSIYTDIPSRAVSAHLYDDRDTFFDVISDLVRYFGIHKADPIRVIQTVKPQLIDAGVMENMLVRSLNEPCVAMLDSLPDNKGRVMPTGLSVLRNFFQSPTKSILIRRS